MCNKSSSKDEGATSKNEETTSKNEEILSSNQMKCEYCNKIIWKSNRARHNKTCKSKKEKLAQNELEKKLAKLELEKRKIEEEKNKLAIEKEAAVKENKQLAAQKEELQKDFAEFMRNVSRNGLGNTIIQNDNRKMNYYYILNN